MVVLRKTPEHENGEGQGDRAERPHHIHDRLGSDPLGWVDTIESVPPVPQRRDCKEPSAIIGHSPCSHAHPKSAADPGRHRP